VLGSNADKFSYVIVRDIETPGAFDEAVRGVDAVIHTASPVTVDAEDPQDLIGPAVSGTTGILQSIKKYAPNVRRVVITSSVASIWNDKGGFGFTLDETEWNTTSPEVVTKEGRNASGWHKYRTSKVLAERAAWEFVEHNKGDIAFDLVTICPPIVWGPILQEAPTVEALNFTIATFREVTSTQGKELTLQELTTPVSNFVDVRDVALVHTLALSNPRAGGERFITSSGPYAWQDVLDTLHASGEHPDVPKGHPGAAKDVLHNVYTNAKAEGVFGIKFRDMAETTAATLKSLRERGF
ncbi:methylglyoxal reductase (NADPH-dependent) gre2, partial [Tulasnella sp. 403]